MQSGLLVAFGGAIGTLFRYLMTQLIPKFAFPFGTLVVNLLGSFLIGFVWEYVEQTQVSPQVKLFFVVGILGGYTTFSAFSMDNYQLIRQGQYVLVAVNIALSVGIGIGFVCLGCFCAKFLLQHK